MDINTKLSFSSLRNQTTISNKESYYDSRNYPEVLHHVQLSDSLNDMLLVLKQEMKTHSQTEDIQIFFYIDSDDIVHITDRCNGHKGMIQTTDIKIRLLAYLRKCNHNDDYDVHVNHLLNRMTFNDLLHELDVLVPATEALDPATSKSSSWCFPLVKGIKSLLRIIFCCWLCRRHDSSTESTTESSPLNQAH